MIKQYLSKTKFMEAMRCRRLVWLRFNKPELAESLDQQTTHLFETGHRVEEIAHKLFPGGIRVGKFHPHEYEKLTIETYSALKSGKPFLFEGAFSNKRAFCRTDVLEHVKGNIWNLGEIKMCTHVKPQHYQDCGFQLYCIEKSGLKIQQVYLVHVNNGYNYTGGTIDQEKFLAADDITKEAVASAKEIPDTMQSIVSSIFENIPEVQIGSQCKNPGRCPFYTYCHKDIPSGSVYELPYGHKITPVLIKAGIHLLKDIPEKTHLTIRQSALVKSAKTKEPVINKVAINDFLHTLKFPLYFMDFETISPCIPLLINSSPYERIAFQYSVHVQETPVSKLQNYSYLPENAGDPRKQLLSSLIETLGKHGSIIVWNIAFEKSVLKGLSQRFPEYSNNIDEITDRIVDLIIPFRSGAYSDVRFGGSASIKKVLPVLVPSLSYDSLNINHGEEASLKFELFLEGTTGLNDWQISHKDLLEYCQLDTYAMYEILKVLFSVTRKNGTKYEK